MGRRYIEVFPSTFADMNNANLSAVGPTAAATVPEPPRGGPPSVHAFGDLIPLSCLFRLHGAVARPAILGNR